VVVGRGLSYPYLKGYATFLILVIFDRGKMEFVAISATSFVVMLGEHFIPWHDATNKSKLPRPAAYVIGTGSLTAMQLMALALWPILNASLVILIVVICGGAGVLAGYAIDAVRHAKSSDRILDKALEVRHE
jgi:hypothetical protein